MSEGHFCLEKNEKRLDNMPESRYNDYVVYEMKWTKDYD